MNPMWDSLLWAVFWKSGVALGAALGVNLGDQDAGHWAGIGAGCM